MFILNIRIRIKKASELLTMSTRLNSMLSACLKNGLTFRVLITIAFLERV
jgi:hypothetical protein